MQTLNNLLLLAKVFWRHFQTSDSEISLLVEVHKPVSHPPPTQKNKNKNNQKHQQKKPPRPVQCCFTSTETIRLIRTATSTSTQLLSSENPHPALESTYKYSFVHFSLLKNDTGCSSVGEIPICWRNYLMPDVLTHPVRPVSVSARPVSLVFKPLHQFLVHRHIQCEALLGQMTKAITSFYRFAVTFI